MKIQGEDCEGEEEKQEKEEEEEEEGVGRRDVEWVMYAVCTHVAMYFCQYNTITPVAYTKHGGKYWS